ncbi:RIO1 family regulatory kinase/ATPase [uncultured Cycloclasticus sp.]|uniref:RIO1 family regulatory kinase/ATPase domain-containing protein n=1 Tax=uncultured Cycloclasticus sp. TaxID=172194 RepID=UPI002589E804|nr:RIO1 family regulatory kinase/ATPase [uncultured Cycloclasticus sp.]
MPVTNTWGKPLFPVHCLSPGKRLKANVYIAKYGDQQVVIKDFSTAPFYLKPVVRILVKREIRALQRLQGSAHVPRLVKVIEPYGFVMEYIEGSHPSNESWFQYEGVYTEAIDFLLTMHRAGVIHNDLRRKNLILHPQRGMVFIDFGAALIRPYCPSEKKVSWFSPGCWLSAKLRVADFYHLIRLKHYLSQEPLTCQELRLLRTGRPFQRVTNMWKILFRGKHCRCSYRKVMNALHQPALAKFVSAMKWGSDQNARQRRG